MIAAAIAAGQSATNTVQSSIRQYNSRNSACRQRARRIGGCKDTVSLPPLSHLTLIAAAFGVVQRSEAPGQPYKRYRWGRGSAGVHLGETRIIALRPSPVRYLGIRFEARIMIHSQAELPRRSPASALSNIDREWRAASPCICASRGRAEKPAGALQPKSLV